MDAFFICVNALNDVHQRIGAVLAKFSIKSVAGFMTFWMGHLPDVSDQVTSFRIRNMVKKKRIRSAKTDLPSLPRFPSPVLSKLLNKLSLMVTELTQSIAKVALELLGETDIVTPLRSIVDCEIIIFCMLTTRIKISDIIAIKSTGLNTKSSSEATLRYWVIPFPSPGILSLLNILNKMINGDAIMNIRKKATLTMLAIRRRSIARVNMRSTIVLSENPTTTLCVVGVPCQR